MGQVFISYSHTDKEFAHWIQHDLVSRGFDAWVDDRLDYGSQWLAEIEKRLKACDAFILIMSPEAHDSHWVNNELATAIRLKKPILPFLLSGDPWMAVAAIQYVDVTNGKKPGEFFYERLAELASRFAAEPSSENEKNSPSRLVLHVGGNLSGNVIVGSSNALEKPDGNIQIPSSTGSSQTKRHVIWNAWMAEIKKRRWVIAFVTIVFVPALIWWGINASYPLEINDRQGIRMRLVPYGYFWMGSMDKELDERPIQRVFLSSYYMDVYEVTNTMFEEFVDKTGWVTTAEKIGDGSTFDSASSSLDKWDFAVPGADWRHPQGPGSTLEGLGNHPVVQVSWYDAVAYCKWRDARLPSEAEWEKAARGAEDQRDYPWGGEKPSAKFVNFADINLSVNWADQETNDGYAFTSPVGLYPAGASPYGLLDMAGNVWEWVDDWYAPYPGGAPELNINPMRDRSARGGSWYYYPYSLRVSIRGKNPPEYRASNLGFRCVRSSP